MNYNEKAPTLDQIRYVFFLVCYSDFFNGHWTTVHLNNDIFVCKPKHKSVIKIKMDFNVELSGKLKSYY